jgi:hypothetical protein
MKKFWELYLCNGASGVIAFMWILLTFGIMFWILKWG